MGQENNIDNLFKAKLAGRDSAAAYSASAWAGADKALGGHFKLLLLKKAAFILIPILVISGAGAWYFADFSNKDVSAIAQENALETTTGADAFKPSENDQTQQGDLSKDKATFALETTSSSINQKNEIAVHENANVTGAFENVGGSSTSLPANSEVPSKKAVLSSEKRTLKLSSKTKVAEANDGSGIATKITTSAIRVPGGFGALLDEFVDDESSDVASIDMVQNTTSIAAESAGAVSSKEFMYGMPIYNLKTLGSKRALLTEKKESVDFGQLPNAKTLEFGLNGGLVGATTLENNLGTQSKIGLGAYAGLNIQYHVKPRLFLYSAAILNTRNGLGTKSQSADPTISVFPTQLLYLDIPLHVGYRLGARHGLSFGMTFSPLLIAKNEDQHREDYGANPTTSFSKDGFASFDVAGSVNYSFSIAKRLDLNASVRFGLFDVTDDNYFSTGPVDDRNHQLRLGINYRFRAR
jgi:hypothetical protein